METQDSDESDNISMMMGSLSPPSLKTPMVWKSVSVLVTVLTLPWKKLGTTASVSPT